MKRLFALLLSGLALARMAHGDTASVYNNVNGVNVPPQTYLGVDATNFFNNNVFNVTIDNSFIPLDFSDVQNFTNRNQINIYPGVRFDTVDASGAHTAKWFVNANNINTNFNNTSVYGPTWVYVDATNVINRGTLSSTSSGLVSVHGDNVDISRSAMSMGTFGLGGGIVDDYWGFSTNTFDPNTNLFPTLPWVPLHTAIFPDSTINNAFTFPTVPLHSEFISYTVPPFPFQVPLSGSGLQAFYRLDALGTNQTLTIVFVRTSDPGINVGVTFSGDTPSQLGQVSVEWSILSTNVFNQQVGNFLTLQDTYGMTTTNVFVTNLDSFRPQNFTLTLDSVSHALGVTGTPYTSLFQLSTFGTNQVVFDVISNRVAAYGATVFTTAADPSAGSPELSFADHVRQMPGRVELQANKLMNLNLSRVQSSSYVLISSTNHFTGSSNAVISTPYADLRLGSTNGNLVATDVIQPLVRRLSGTIDVYSGVWNNQILVGTNTATAQFNVIYVDAQLNSVTPSTLLDVNLRSLQGTNEANKGSVTIGDNFNITGTFNVDAANLTVATNGAVLLNLENPDDGDWASDVAYLQSFTNYGSIVGQNGLFFLGRGLAPDGSDLPYTNFVNGGTIQASAVTVSANNFQTSGGLRSLSGGSFIQAGTLTISYVPPFTGFLFANNADIDITCLNLNVTNQTLVPTILAGRALSLVVSNNVNVGSNYWSVGDGFNLFVKPATGDFSLLTVTNLATEFENVNSTWAGEDRGFTAAGFVNNGALGRLILDGAENSAFTFSDLTDGDLVTNALYVDVLVLRNNATNLDVNGNLANVYIQPEMKLYYSQVFFDTTDVTAGLSTKSAAGGGGFFQLTHAGAINTASVPGMGGGGGTTLVDVGLNVTSDGSTATISWNTLAGAVNYVYYKPSAASGSWQLLTSFTASATGSTSVQDPAGGGMRVYQVRVDLPTQ